MKIKIAFISLISVIFTGLTLANPMENSINTLDRPLIEKIMGAKGEMTAENKLKFLLPRNDLKININGIKFTPSMGLTSMISFQILDQEVAVSADLILAEDQVNPVMSIALDNGLQITSLHNHFFWETPKIMLMHITGNGKNSKDVAKAMGKVIAKIKSTQGGRGDILFANINPAETNLNLSKINAILGTKGNLKQGVYRISIGEKTPVNSSKNWAAFIGTNKEAMVDGELSISADKLLEVLTLLRKAGIYIISIHKATSGNDMFLHYYGIGTIDKLAKALRSVALVVAAVTITPELAPLPIIPEQLPTFNAWFLHQN